MSGFTLVLIVGVVALDTAGDWAAETTVNLAVTGCTEGADVYGPDCAGVDFARGALASHEFREMSPSMRWLRINLSVFVAPSELLFANATIQLSVTLDARNNDGEAWRRILAAPTERPLLCAEPSLRSSIPCDVFNAAFWYGLAHTQYRVTVQLREPLDEPTDEHATAVRAQALRGVSMSALHGKAALGRLDLGVRFAGLFVSAAALLWYVVSMLPFAPRLWMPQQKAILPFLVTLLLYNDPSRAFVTLDGVQDYLAPSVRSRFARAPFVACPSLRLLISCACAPSCRSGAQQSCAGSRVHSRAVVARV